MLKIFAHPPGLSLKIAGMVAIPMALAPLTARSQSLSERHCAKRISIALTGTSNDRNILDAQEPKAKASEILRSPRFIDRFAAFANANMNDMPGGDKAQDVSYNVVKYVLENNLSWKDVFKGKLNQERLSMGREAKIQADPNGLGLFRTDQWLKRYAGNEEEGIRLTSIYRMMQNTIGLELQASVNAPSADVSANGREAPGCRGCHFESWFALDKNAQVLARVNFDKNGNFGSFKNRQPKEETVLDDKTAKNDQEFVELLLNSRDFSYNACRLAFTYVTGRQENTCESDQMNDCIKAFEKSYMIQDALMSFINDEQFCQ